MAERDEGLKALDSDLAKRDAEANRIHGASAAVKKFADILYPNCIAPVEFIEYQQVDANAVFRRQ